MYDLVRYFQRHNLEADAILYIYRQDGKTVIHSENEADAVSMIPVHEVEAFLPEGAFVSIAKGVVVRRSGIVHISDAGVYTMADGKTFQGRRRYLSEHKRLRRELGLDVPSSQEEFKAPLAYCVIELVFDADGHGVDFIFRYCNKQMAVVEGVPVEEMLNRSFYEVFRNGDRKWLVSYADVALNGTKHTLRDFSPEIGKNLTIYCYQPEPGFCACVLLPE